MCEYCRTVRLGGMNLLIVEDEYFLAMDIKKAAEEAGAKVIGPIGDVDDLPGNTDQIDMALLDINLRERRVWDFARLLKKDFVPFAFVTGYERESFPAEFSTIPTVSKPFRECELVKMLARLDASF